MHSLAAIGAGLMVVGLVIGFVTVGLVFTILEELSNG